MPDPRACHEDYRLLWPRLPWHVRVRLWALHLWWAGVYPWRKGAPTFLRTHPAAFAEGLWRLRHGMRFERGNAHADKECPMKEPASALQREARWREATAKYARGEISREQLRKIERENATPYREGVRAFGRAIGDEDG